MEGIIYPFVELLQKYDLSTLRGINNSESFARLSETLGF